jgi:cellulose biosynthesis protein BcsQ
MVDLSKPLHRDVMAQLRSAHAREILGAVIPDSDDVERMGVVRDVVSSFAPGSRGALAYQSLWWDVRRRLGAA